MSGVIAQIIDNGIVLTAVAFLLRFYFKPEGTRLHRKKWVLFLCAFMILGCLVDVGSAYRKYLRNRIPSPRYLKKTFAGHKTVGKSDLQYVSPYGYSIKIPSGSSYTEFASGPISIIAIKGTTTLLVSRLYCKAAELDKIIQETVLYLKRKNPTYVFEDRQNVMIGSTPAIRLEFSVTKKEIAPIKGLMIFFKKDGKLFQVMLTCSATEFSANKLQFESIIASLKL